MKVMKLNRYRLEILNVLDENYPNSLKKSKLLALLSEKNPRKLERELSYFEEMGLIEEKEVRIDFPWISVPFRLSKFKITAKGIDKLDEKRERRTKYLKMRKKVKQPVAFISASFDDGADPLITWVRNRAHNVGINTIWLKESYQARPPIDKIDEAISSSDCIIQIITSHVFQRGGEAGWIGNEMGMAFKGRPGKNVAVFVQEGRQASGLAPLLTDVFPIRPRNLARYEKKAEKYLKDLRSRIKIIEEE